MLNFTPFIVINIAFSISGGRIEESVFIWSIDVMVDRHASMLTRSVNFCCHVV